ncbi:response regulator, partial [Pseudomonas sp. GW460-C8]|uniref:response regulator n=1 Tax=Pseudomonas sp. GW460-C8 TaxID=2070589 RepID=UPI001304F8B3
MLVVDDEKNIRSTLTMALETLGCRVSAVATGHDARQALARRRHDLCFLDLRLGDENGVDLLPALLEAAPGLDVIIVTAFATV